MAWSRSAMAVTIVAFLPPVSASKCSDGLSRSMFSAVSVPPVRITALTPAWFTSCRPARLPAQGRNCSVFRETPPRQKHWQSSQAGSTESEAGLRITQLPAASAAATPPEGMAMGKFQGDTTTTTPLGRARSAGMLVPPLGVGAIELDEIDRFGDFRIGLGNRLAAVGQSRADQVAARLAEFVGDMAQPLEAGLRRHRPPAVLVGHGTVPRRDRRLRRWPDDSGRRRRPAAMDRGTRGRFDLRIPPRRR